VIKQKTATQEQRIHLREPIIHPTEMAPLLEVAYFAGEDWGSRGTTATEE